jgi:hypothetical protein
MPWKAYDPKLAMPKSYNILSDWGVVIPTSDEVAWTTNPKYNWIYNKLDIAKSQNIPCGPIGTDPTEYPIIVKPITNLAGGGTGAFVCHSKEQYKKAANNAGYFWSRYNLGEHYSVDLILLNGIVQLDITFIGEKLQLGMFDYWRLSKTPPNLLHKLKDWISKNLANYTGCLNVEVIDNNIIEAHLRFGDLDRLGDTDLLEAIHILYNANKWVYTDKVTEEFYIAALFGQPSTKFTINPKLANHLFSDLTYFQIDSSGIEPIGNPLQGNRLAIFCDKSLQKVTNARNIAIALFNPDIDGKYTDVLTNYENLSI